MSSGVEAAVFERLTQISVILIDDHQLVRSGLARLLEDAPDIKLLTSFASGEEVVDYLGREGAVRPNVVLMEARMPGMGGIEATRSILELSPTTRVVGMSEIAGGVIPSKILRAGAIAFITKSVDPLEMYSAIRAAKSGSHYVSADAATQLRSDPFRDPDGAVFEKLSRRELQVAGMLTDGRKVVQISSYLSLSPKTVYSYRYRIFEKLGVRNDTELTVLAVRHGLATSNRDLEVLFAS